MKESFFDHLPVMVSQKWFIVILIVTFFILYGMSFEIIVYFLSYKQVISITVGSISLLVVGWGVGWNVNEIDIEVCPIKSFQ